MATPLDQDRNPSWNLLRCDGTALSPNLLLAGKLLVFYMVGTGQFMQLSHHFLPFWPVFDQLGSPEAFHTTLQITFYFFAATLLLNRFVRTSCFMIGLVLLISILSQRANYGSSPFFFACFFLLLGLQEENKRPWLIRFQISLAYFGAALNKMLEPDWQSGQYFEYWTHEILNHQFYISVASNFPKMLLSKLICWLTITIEYALAVGFLVPRLYNWAICLGILFHMGMLVFSGGILSVVFTYAMLTSYLAFIEWPNEPIKPINVLKYFLLGALAITFQLYYRPY